MLKQPVREFLPRKPAEQRIIRQLKRRAPDADAKILRGERLGLRPALKNLQTEPQQRRLKNDQQHRDTGRDEQRPQQRIQNPPIIARTKRLRRLPRASQLQKIEAGKKDRKQLSADPNSRQGKDGPEVADDRRIYCALYRNGRIGQDHGGRNHQHASARNGGHYPPCCGSKKCPCAATNGLLRSSCQASTRTFATRRPRRRIRARA